MFTVLLDFISRFIGIFLRTDSGSFPSQLSAGEEKKLFALVRQGDKSARSKLIEHNLRLVAHIVKKYYTACEDQDDLISIGTVGLIKAIDSFDTKNGARLATYAGKCIQNEILMYFRAQKKYSCEVSLGEAVDTDKDGNPLTYIDILASDEDVTETIAAANLRTELIRAIRCTLSQRETEIIVLRMGLQGKPPMPQRAVAEALGISRSYVSRIEKTALDKLKNYLNANGYN